MPNLFGALRNRLSRRTHPAARPEAPRTVRRARTSKDAVVQLPDPELLAKHVGQASYYRVKGDLFVDGVSATDVLQGRIGDCYLAAAITAVAAQAPKAIEEAFASHGNGTYTVRLFEKVDGRLRPVRVEVDADLAFYAGERCYGRNSDDRELWASLLEKAFAQWKGGYERIGNGGDSGSVMEAITGRPKEKQAIHPGINTDFLYYRLKKALAAGRCATAATHFGSEYAEQCLSAGLIATHVYAIVGVFEEDGVKKISLRNPWGRRLSTSDPSDGGIFSIDLAAFAKHFATTNVV